MLCQSLRTRLPVHCPFQSDALGRKRTVSVKASGVCVDHVHPIVPPRCLEGSRSEAGGFGNALGAHRPVSWEKEGEAIFNGNCTDRALLLFFLVFSGIADFLDSEFC